MFTACGGKKLHHKSHVGHQKLTTQDLDKIEPKIGESWVYQGISISYLRVRLKQKKLLARQGQ